ncbi:hypothetical protein THASP1DRAFT_28852 [Thamnocephalis sphaerospora]|uniref:Uncharacterized protein n=1 Tax=Thamnocephalis sphaerospora TaxID=78915 RepID=A0A4P9XTN4_9FUNG|nr:hypothetical protein THASP1DRAFT_28852 [Thamnocephalis sphaerospora]|eukprot:RKP09352.1 hypothetical protein THASP1DRAFT_28852 [Thamnocephalis sphaerospora]
MFIRKLARGAVAIALLVALAIPNSTLAAPSDDPSRDAAQTGGFASVPVPTATTLPAPTRPAAPATTQFPSAPVPTSKPSYATAPPSATGRPQPRPGYRRGGSYRGRRSARLGSNDINADIEQLKAKFAKLGINDPSRLAALFGGFAKVKPPTEQKSA